MQLIAVTVHNIPEGMAIGLMFGMAYENSNVAWQPIDKVVELSTEPHMKVVYEKLIELT